MLDGLEPWCCEDITGIVAPKIGPRSLFAKSDLKGSFM